MWFDLLYLSGVSEESEWEGVNECIEFVYDRYFLEWIGSDAGDGIENREQEQENIWGGESIEETNRDENPRDDETLADRDDVFGFAIRENFREEDEIYDWDKYPERLERDAIFDEILRERLMRKYVWLLSSFETVFKTDLFVFFSDDANYLTQISREWSCDLIQGIHRWDAREKWIRDVCILHKELHSEENDRENIHKKKDHRKRIKSRPYKVEEIEEGKYRRESRPGRGDDIFVSFRDNHPEKWYMRQEKHHPIGLGSTLISEGLRSSSKRENMTDFLGLSSFLRIIDSWEDEESESHKETKAYESVDGEVDNRDIVEKKLAEEIRVDDVWYKEHSVSFRRTLCMILYEGIRKIRIFPGKKEHPSEEEIADSRVVSDFAWEHRKRFLLIFPISVAYFSFFYKKIPTYRNKWGFFQSLRNYPWAFLLRSRYTWRTIAFSRSFRLEISRIA